MSLKRNRPLVKFLSIALLMVLFSCTSENKTIFISKQNPILRPDLIAAGDKFYAAEAENSLAELAFIGPFDSQIEPCHCFMRPFGGLKRIEKFVTQTKIGVVVAGTLTEPSIDGPVDAKLLETRLVSFLKATKPIVTVFDPIDLPFWSKNRKELSAQKILASNLRFSDDALKASLSLEPFIDSEFGGRKYRFFYFVKPGRAVSGKFEVESIESSFAKLLKATPNDMAIVAIAADIEDLRKTIQANKSVTRPFMAVTASSVEAKASSDFEEPWLKVAIERRTRSVAVLKLASTEAFYQSEFVDIAGLEYKANLFQNTLERVLEETRGSELFKEKSDGYDIPRENASYFEVIQASLPSAKSGKVPLKLESLDLSNAYD